MPNSMAKQDYSAEVSEHESPLVRMLLMCSGVLFVVMGLIGLVLPIMPTTVFLLLAASSWHSSCIASRPVTGRGENHREKKSENHDAPAGIGGNPKVGNSGNTTEPHLRLHAQRNGSADYFLDGEPVPMRIDGKFLVRTDRVSC